MTFEPFPSVAQVKGLLNLFPGMAAAFDPHGLVFAANSSWTDFFRGETSVKKLEELSELIGTQEESTLIELCRQSKAVGRNHSIQGWMSPPNGSERWIRWTATSDDQSGLTVVAGSDETSSRAEQVKRDKARKEFDSRYASVVIGVFHCDLSGRFLRVNDGFSRIVGHTAEDLIGKSFADITHPDDVDEDLGRVQLLLSGGIDHFSTEKRFVSTQGDTVWAYLTVKLMRDEDSLPMMLMGAISEISSNQAKGSVLRETEEYFRSWIDPNDRTFWSADPDGAIRDASHNAGVTTGVGRDGLLNEGWRSIVHPADLDRTVLEWANSVANGTRYQCEYRVRILEGSYRWVRSQAVPHRDSRGKILGWYGCTDDIQIQKLTEEKLSFLVAERTQELMAANEALTEARDAALAASLSKSQFLANISHEIRTPMNGVIGLASILQEQPLDPKSRGMVDLICQSGETLIKIIEDILDFSKIEAGKVCLDPTETDLVDVLSSVLGLFQGHAKLKDINLRFDVIAPLVPPVLVDQLRLRQVVSNLISNAIKFTQAGSVVLVLDGTPTDGQFLLDLKVTDTGIGIPPERIDFIFDSFTQGDGSTQRKYGGTGLGLSISKDLVQLMGGRLWAQSEFGRGTTMRVELPLKIP